MDWRLTCSHGCFVPLQIEAAGQIRTLVHLFNSDDCFDVRNFSGLIRTDYRDCVPRNTPTFLNNSAYSFNCLFRDRRRDSLPMH